MPGWTLLHGLGYNPLSLPSRHTGRFCHHHLGKVRYLPSLPSPAALHYQEKLTKEEGVAIKYLRNTIDCWGIIYWRSAFLLHIPLEPLVYDSSLPAFPSTSDLLFNSSDMLMPHTATIFATVDPPQDTVLCLQEVSLPIVARHNQILLLAALKLNLSRLCLLLKSPRSTTSVPSWCVNLVSNKRLQRPCSRAMSLPSRW